MGISNTLSVFIMDRNDEFIEVSTSNPCDGIARMLFTGKPNYRTGFTFTDTLEEADLKLVKPTYTADSESVLEEYESFSPNHIDASDLLRIFEKLRQELTKFHRIQTYGDNPDKSKSEESLFELMSVSELISALQVAQQLQKNVYLGIRDS